MDPLPTRPLPCPECRLNGRGGGARIGNNRSGCGTCNRFNQRVLRVARQRLVDKHSTEYSALRLEVEVELYKELLDEWDLEHFVPVASDIPAPEEAQS